MNQYFSISQLKLKFGRFWLLLMLITLVVGSTMFGFWLGDKSLGEDKKMLAGQQLRLAQLYADADNQVQQINFLQVEIEIEKQAAKHVQQQLQNLHQENFKLQKALSFYQKIMAPELQAGGVAVDQLVITPTAANNIYDYKIVLLQTHKQKRYAKGSVNFTVTGTKENSSVSFGANQLIVGFEKQMLAFSFKYFQILEGQLHLPDDFIASDVQLTVVLPSGKWQKFEQLDVKFPFHQDSTNR